MGTVTTAALLSPQMLTLYGVVALGIYHILLAVRGGAAPSSATPAATPAATPTNAPAPTGHPVLDAVKHMVGGATLSNAEEVLGQVASILTATGNGAAAAPAVDPTTALLVKALTQQPAAPAVAPAKAA